VFGEVRDKDMLELGCGAVEGSATKVPLADASFDLIFCDHGGLTWADPFQSSPSAGGFYEREAS
jgi:ubiquinone/menaquinone biosynthesis C-methylase UbiE